MKQLLRAFIFIGLIFASGLSQAQITPHFSGSPRHGCSPIIFTVTDSSTSSSTITYRKFTLIYDSKDSVEGSITYTDTGAFSNTFILSDTGWYDIIEVVANSAGDTVPDSQGHYVYVSGPLTTRVSTTSPATDTNTCVGRVIKFINLSDTIAGCTPYFSWTISGPSSDTIINTTGTAATVSFAVTSVGFYEVILRETTCTSCSGNPNAPYNINVQAYPVACFSNNDSTACHAPSIVDFTNCSSGDVTHYLWKFGDGSNSTAVNPAHTYSASGTITDTLIAYSSYGCADTLIKTGNVIVGNFNPGFTVSDSVICRAGRTAAGTITFTDTTFGATAYNWYDNYGPPHTSSSYNPTFTYSTSGTYRITDSVYNSTGCFGVVTRTFTVNTSPAVTFTATPLYRCSPNDTVTFTATATDPSGISSYEWHFGNGRSALDSSNLNPAVHIYTALGTYTDSLKVTDNNGCATLSTKVSYIDVTKPVFTITVTNDSGCVPFNVHYTTSAVSLAGATLGYKIDSVKYGDAVCCAYHPAADTISGMHSYTTGGTYSITVTYTLPDSLGGCTFNKSITVKAGTTHPSFTPTISTDSVCPNTTFTLVAHCSACTSFQFEFGSTTVTSFDTTHQYSTAGLQEIYAIGNISGCTTTDTVPIYVFPPAASVSASVPNCDSPNVVHFSSSGSTGATGYHWNFGDLTTGTGPSPVHTYTTGTGHTYTVTLIDSAGGAHHCTNIDSITVSLFPFVASFHATDTVACKGTSVTFTADLTPTGTDYTYSFHFGDGSTPYTTSSVNSYNHIYSNTGTYSDTVIFTDAFGCAHTVAKPNYIKVGGLSGGLTASTTSGCAPLSVLFSDNNTDYTGFTITKRYWDFNVKHPHAVSGAGVPDSAFARGSVADTTVTFPRGVYEVILIDSDNIGCTVRDTVHINAQQPVPYFYSPDSGLLACTGKTIYFYDTTNTTGFTYLWSYGDGTTGTGPNPTHVYSVDGVYSVKLTITATAGSSFPLGCTGSVTRASYIKIGHIGVDFKLSDTSRDCAPIDEFAYNLTSPVGANTYQWRVTPTGAIVSTNTNLLYKLTAGGTTYEITLIATNSVGCTESITKAVVIKGIGGYIHFSTDSGCTPLTSTLCFTDTNGTSPTNFTWLFRDGTPSSTSSSASDTCVTHIFHTSGSPFNPYVTIITSGCDHPEAFYTTDSIYVFPIPRISVTADSFICYGKGDTLTAFGAGASGTYSWSSAYGLNTTSGATVVASPSVTTTYTVTGYSIHGCSSTATVTVTVDPKLNITVSGHDTICFGFCDTLVATGGSVDNYTWYPMSGTSSAIGDSFIVCSSTSQTYSVVYTDPAGCKDTVPKYVYVHPPVLPITAIPSFTVCAGYTTQLADASGSGTWSSSNNTVATISSTGLVSGISQGSSVITFTVPGGCIETNTITVTPSPSPIYGDHSVCVGSIISIYDTVRGGIFTITPSSIATIIREGSFTGIVKGVSAGTAIVSYTLSSDGCASTADITVNPLPVITYERDPAYICLGSTVTVFANSDAAKYLWTPNILISSDTVSNPTFYDTVTKLYNLTETNVFGCIDSQRILITVYDSAVTTISNDTTICIGQSATLFATSTSDTSRPDVTHYMWTALAGDSLSCDTCKYTTVRPDSTSTYSVKITENPCFSAVRNVTVTVIPIPQIHISASAPNPIIAGKSVQLIASSSNNVYISNWLWTPAQFLSCDTCYNPIATPTATTTFTVTGTTPIGCSSENTITVSIICVEAAQIFVPNTFTPNGDGNNDRFYLSGIGLGQITRMSIYNRWGELMFQTQNINANDPGAGWDGTYRGQVLQPDVFVYVFDLLCETGVPFTLKGDVSLVR